MARAISRLRNALLSFYKSVVHIIYGQRFFFALMSPLQGLMSPQTGVVSPLEGLMSPQVGVMSPL